MKFETDHLAPQMGHGIMGRWLTRYPINCTKPTRFRDCPRNGGAHQAGSVPSQIHPVSAPRHQAGDIARRPCAGERGQQVQLAPLRLKEHFGDESRGGDGAIQLHRFGACVVRAAPLLVSGQIFVASLADQLGEDSVGPIAIGQPGPDPDFPGARPVTTHGAVGGRSVVPARAYPSVAGVPRIEALRVVAVPPQIHGHAGRGRQLGHAERIDLLARVNRVQVHEVAMAAVGIVDIGDPLLQLTEAADAERHHALLRIADALAEFGIDFQDFGGMDDVREQVAYHLDILERRFQIAEARLVLGGNGRRLKLSAAGKLFLEDVRRLLQEVNEAVVRAGRVASGRSGTLRVGFTENASWHGVVPDSFRRFRELQPDAELELQPAGSLEQLEAIRSGRLDAGFVFNMPKTDPELELLPVAVQQIELAAPKGHPLTKLKKLRLRDLADATFVWFPRRESPVLHDRLMHECFRGGLKSPRIVQEGLNEATILSLVETDLGVGWVLGTARWGVPTVSSSCPWST
jgi:LysR substrate binding domain